MFMYELYKYVDPLCPILLNKLFNSWTEGIIVPLHKKGSVHCAANYMGITILPTMSKLFTQMLNTRISKWAETSGISADCQAGFRSQHSMVDNVFVLNHINHRWVAMGKTVYTVMIDFTKAFDLVNHTCLFVYGDIVNIQEITGKGQRLWRSVE